MYGIEKGNNQYGYEKNSHPKITQEQLASQMDMDVRTLQNYKMLADMIPELLIQEIKMPPKKLISGGFSKFKRQCQIVYS